MKLKNIYTTLCLSALAVVSCSKDETVLPGRTATGAPFAITVTDGGYANADAPATRAVENGYTTEFTEGDACGLFMIRGINLDKKMIYSNVKLTAERDAATGDLVWKSKDNTTLVGGLSDEHYYLYYPY